MSAIKIARERVDIALRYALGTDIGNLLEDPTITDVMLNEDGAIWADGAGLHRRDSGFTMRSEDALSALFLIADHCGEPLTRQAPVLSATLPRTGERIAATIAPITQQPTFAIRKPPQKVFEIDQFEVGAPATAPERSSSASGDTIAVLRKAIDDRRNILIAGSTGSGKTSLASALLCSAPDLVAARCLILEDTAELVCGAPDHVRMLTTPGVGMRELVQLSLRYRPDRIIVGEVRSGGAAIELIHAMNTGHQGGISTIHANSCIDALGRIEDLCGEVCHQPPRRAIATGIGCIVFVARTATGRAIAEVMLVDGLDESGGYVTTSF